MRTIQDDLAKISHEIWSHWMKYMFSQCQGNPDGSVIIPAIKVERWQRQMHTEFDDLPVSEQLSDYEQASKIMEVCEDWKWSP